MNGAKPNCSVLMKNVAIWKTKRREFEEYSRDLRRAKDQAEFDGFMANGSSVKDVVAKDVTPKKKDKKSVKKSGGGKSIPGV